MGNHDSVDVGGAPGNQQRLETSTSQERSLKKSRWQFVFGGVILVGLAVTFAMLTIQALNIRANTSSEFMDYVAQHGIGTAEVSDDASGFQGDFCVLHLKQPIPAEDLKAEAMQLFQEYNQLDGGQRLTIEYAQGSKTTIQADAILLSNGKDVSLSLHEHGTSQMVQVPISWSPSGDQS